MQVDLDARIVTCGGEEAGNVKRVVVDPATNDVVAFVVSTGGLLGKDVVVPRQDLDRAIADGDRLRLHLSKDELEELPAFVPSGYAVPPASWVPLAGLGYPSSAYLWPLAAAPEVLESPPAGSIDEQHVTVDKGASVLDRNGEGVGVVEEIRLDPESGEIRGVVVQLGGALQTLIGAGRTIDLPGEDIQEVGQDAIRLRVDKSELDRAA